VGTLIDTSVLIAIERGELPLERIQDRDESVALSAVTASELLIGVERAGTPLRRHKRERFVEELFAIVPVLPADLDVARVHARINAHLAMHGTPIGVHDAWIAATALLYRYTVATRNMRAFERVEGLRVERW
jgi:tRNA(fMet)-specific endonuclease VapC